MSHHICTGGCKGVSDQEGVCQTPDCPHFGKPLAPCHCTKGDHGGAFDRLDKLEEQDDAEA